MLLGSESFVSDNPSTRDYAIVVYRKDQFVFEFFDSSAHQRFQEVVHLEEDLLSSLQKVLIIATHLKIQGFYVKDVQSVPVDRLATLSEFLLASQLSIRSHHLPEAPLGRPELIDLRKRDFKLVQKQYIGGCLNGKIIPKYGWYDERFFELVPLSANTFDVYAKRVLNSEAEIVFLGQTEMDKMPKGYDMVGFRNFDYEPDAKERLVLYLKGVHELERFELNNIQFYGEKIWFLSHKNLTNTDRIRNWILEGARIKNEGWRELRIGTHWWSETERDPCPS